MRKVLPIFVVLLLALPLVAQQQTGNILGRVVDQDGTPLPGVTVTLTHRTIRPAVATTGPEGRFRFMSLFPGRDFALKAELTGFKTREMTDIVVEIGRNSDITVVMEVGKLEEAITVVARTPIVDTKKTTVTATLNYESLQALPTARDPWVVLQLTPGFLVDRENVGGSESGQQSGFTSRGTTSQQMTMDGVVITDQASGGSPTYFDFDIFEEMNVTTGAYDVENRTGGLVINLVTRRGGNRTSFGGRFYLTDEAFQNELSAKEIADYGIAGFNSIINIKDFGFNVGGPLFKDKVWWWGSYGVQQIQSTVITGARDDTYLNNYAAKVNIQPIASNRFEFFLHAGQKEKFGRSASTAHPLGMYQSGKYHFGSPIIKLQDEQMFGDSLFLSGKWGFTDAGFGNWPMEDRDLTMMRWYNVEKDLYEQSYSWFFSGRPHYWWQVQGQYFNDSLLGMAHELKFGVDYNNQITDWRSGSPGNLRVNYNYHTTTVDWNNDGKRDVVKNLPGGPDIRYVYLYNNNPGQDGFKSYGYYLNDTITFGRFNLRLGIRYDREHGYIDRYESNRIFDSDTDDLYYENYYEIQQQNLGPGTPQKLAQLLPNVVGPSLDPKFYFNLWSPRIGLTYDIFGDGKTIFKANAAIYRWYTGFSAWNFYPSGVGSGWIRFWWVDENADSRINWEELYWAKYTSARPVYKAFDAAGNFVGDWDDAFGLMWGGYDPQKPTELGESFTKVDPNWTSSYTWELVAGLEKEIFTDFGASLTFTWRRYDHYGRSQSYYPDTGHLRTKDDYEIAGYFPASGTDPKTGTTYSFGKAGGRPWYALKVSDNTLPTDYDYQTNWGKNPFRLYYGADLVLTKRLSNKWYLNASFTLQTQTYNYGSDGYNDPTNLWVFDKQISVDWQGGSSGKANAPLYTPWMVKINGLYQLPYDFNVSFTVNGRRGWIVPEYFSITDYRAPNSRDQSETGYLDVYNDQKRLPDMWNVNLKLEKKLRIGNTGAVYLMVDVFNLFDAHTMNRRYDYNLGTFYYYADGSTGWSKATRSGENNEVLNPRVFRLGARFEF